MRIAVIGVGAVGGYFGGRLAQAGHEVVFVARGRKLEALRNEGLLVQSVAGDFELPPPSTAETLVGEDPVDLVLIAVKTWQVREAAALAEPALGAESVVIPLQNGLEAPARIAEKLGRPDVVLGGLCKIFAEQNGPATVVHSGLEPTIEIGEMSGEASPRVERLRAQLDEAIGMTVIAPESIVSAMWEKLLYVEPLGMVGAASRQPAGSIRECAESRRLLALAAGEIATLAAARGVALDPALPEAALARFDRLAPDTTTSMHRDLAEGRPSELEDQTGVVVRFAQETGVSVPVHEILYAALLPGERRARASTKRS